jgi:ABC-type multidrug transport system ATPase subunit
VILSTHILQEVAAVCSRVLILSEGLIAASGRQPERWPAPQARGSEFSAKDMPLDRNRFLR